MPTNSTTRFSNRVEDYVKYRPGYPESIIPFLQERYQFSTDKTIADIGAGTGISTALFLGAGYTVIAVEPNKEMREKAIELLGSQPGFLAQDGTAEATGLANGSVNAVIAGQAFHWFDAKKTRAEFKRILKPGGSTVLIWNERKTTSAFEVAYDALIVQHARDYVQVDHRNIDTDSIAAFFAPEPFEYKLFSNQQVFHVDGLKGRLLSSSYMPGRTEPGHEAMLADLEKLFSSYQQGGAVTINYDTKLYAGRL